MQPLVLAIEPDLRQAAIVKRIVREKVLAEVAVVDSRDAALEAMRTAVPDVLLLSTLLSPRDEDELMAHLKTLEHAEHLQTHTIPQLASSMASDEQPESKGLLSAFRRKKSAGRAPAGCDPDLFAEEIRNYLRRASDKKREVQDLAAIGPYERPRPGDAIARPVETRAADEPPASGSSWASPFEWRPTSTPTPVPAPVPAPAPAAVSPEVPIEKKMPALMHPDWAIASALFDAGVAMRDAGKDSILRALALPFEIAFVSGAVGCRVRRVRVLPA